jgi:hypothetical protein
MLAFGIVDSDTRVRRFFQQVIHNFRLYLLFRFLELKLPDIVFQQLPLEQLTVIVGIGPFAAQFKLQFANGLLHSLVDNNFASANASLSPSSQDQLVDTG